MYSGVGIQRAGGNSSESDSDWDTTVDFPTPRHTTHDNALDSGAEDSQVPPTPRARPSLSGTERVDRSGDAAYTPRSTRREETIPQSARQDLKTPASASGIHLSARDNGSRNPSPVPPYMAGFRDAVRNGEDSSRRGSPSPPGKDRKGNRYDPAPTPKVPASIEAAGPIPDWDDSDAEQQTLRDLHTTLKKEKTREKKDTENARKQLQDEGDHGSVTGRYQSTLEKWMQGQEDKRRQKNEQEANQQAVLSQARKTGVTAMPAHWSERGQYNENTLPPGTNAPYQSFVIKDPDGKKFVYFFNEGNAAFYEVEEEESEAVMPKVAEKMEGYVQRGWQEFFGVLRILTSIAVFLAVEALNYITNHIARPLFLSVVVMTGNRLIKPVLAGLFNLILQPFIIFCWNVMSGVRHVLQPVIDVLGGVMAKCAILLQAFRLVEVNLGDDYLRSRRVVGAGGGARHNIEDV